MRNENATTIIIPEGTVEIKDEEFANYKNLLEVIIPDSVTIIGDNAFSGCTSLQKVKLSNNLKIVGLNVFANCKSLKEIEIPESLQYLGYGMFSYCTNLENVKCHDNISYIDDFALYNCRRLRNFSLPKNIQSLGVKALCGCNKIEKIVIPKSLDNIELAALSLMASLREISVEEGNTTYLADEGVALINRETGVLVQYAINSREESYTVGYYLVNMNNFESPALTYNIGDYAFAGAKYLKEINVPSEIESIGTDTFLNCNRLTDLNIFHTPFGKTLLFNIHNSNFNEAHIPFKKITIEDGVTTLTDNLSELFKNAREVKLPNTLEHIGNDVFRQSRYLKELEIPATIKMIMPWTFNPNIILKFADFQEMRAKEFNMLETKTSDDAVKRFYDKDNVRILSLVDGTYYVTIDDYDTVRITIDEIDALSSTSHLVDDKPDTFFYYLSKLLFINADQQNLINKVIFNKKLSDLFDKFINDLDYVGEVANKKHSWAIREILDTNDINDEVIFNGILMQNVKKEDLVLILENFNCSMKRFFKFCDCFNGENTNEVMVAKTFNNIPKLIEYCKLLEKCGKKDRFLYNPKFFLNLEIEQQEFVIKHCNSNFKRLVNESHVLDDASYDNCLEDLLKFASIMGVFSGDEKLNQKSCNFMIEKLFAENTPEGLENDYRIVGNSIHKVFDDISPRELDSEFILFFIENYKELIETEKTTSGFIARVYDAFRNISECSTAHTGRQRHLKVTVRKCKNYFLMGLDNLGINTLEDQLLAEQLGKYYTLNGEILTKANLILKEAEKAPRNIFTKVEYDEDGNPIYDCNPDNDLRDTYSDSSYSYEWLPKQSHDNLILGKYCGCCAHLSGAGAGIMRASMILDCCQNMVIKDGLGKIIAKATLWVNKDKGYAVFNTLEMHTVSPFDNVTLKSVYEAFVRGAEDFLEVYNKNNPTQPILNISIGEKGNAIGKVLLDENFLEISPYEALNYSTYGYQLGEKMVGTYAGDSLEKQILVLKYDKRK